MTHPPRRPRLAVLAAVDATAATLAAWLDAARSVADVVVVHVGADCPPDVRDRLAATPSVTVVDDGEGPGDSQVRQHGDVAAQADRLLAAADALDVDWVLWLHDDERLAACDAPALRDFLATDALPGPAYLLETPTTGAAPRLFAHRPRQRSQEGPEHGPVPPNDIPPDLWVRTTLTIEPVDNHGSPRQRPLGTPVLVPSAPPPEDDAPVLTVVVVATAVDDVTAALASFAAQECPEPFDLLVVTDDERVASAVNRSAIDATVVEVPQGLWVDEALNASLAAASGDYVLVVDAAMRAFPGCFSAVVQAHDDGAAVVVPRLVAPRAGPVVLASHAVERARRPGGVAGTVPASYVREVLLARGGFPVDPQLALGAAPLPDAVLVHDPGCRGVVGLVRRHVALGRASAVRELAHEPYWRLVPRSARGLPPTSPTWTGGPSRLAGLAAAAQWSGRQAEELRATATRGVGLRGLGLAGAPAPLPPRGTGPQERAQRGVVLDLLYPLAPYHPWVARTPVAVRRVTRRAVTRAAVGAHLRRRRGTRMLAITGSAGKTTTKDLLGAVLAARGPTVRTRANENGLWGVPATLLAVRPGDRYAVLEVGIKGGPGEMRWMASLFRPEVAVLTGIGDFHTDVLGSVEAVAREKRALLERLDAHGTAVVNADDERARVAALDLPCRVVLAGWADDADVRIVSARPAWPHGTDVELDVGGRRVSGRVAVHGRHLLPPVALAVAAAGAVGVDPLDALDAAGAFSPRIGRYSPTPGPRGSMLIVDDWKSRVTTAVAAVEALGDIPDVRHVAVLGEVQSEEHTADTYRPVADALLAADVDLVVAVGASGTPLTGLLSTTALARRVRAVPDADAAARALAPELRPGTVALLHGSGHHDLELVALRLDPGADPAWLRDWRTRPVARVGRPVAEVLALLGGAAAPETVWRHGASLTWVGSTGHRLAADGLIHPVDDGALVQACRATGVRPLLVLVADEPENPAAVAHAAATAMTHATATGTGGILLDLGSRPVEPGSPLDALLARLAVDLRSAGLSSGVLTAGDGPPPPSAAAVDLLVTPTIHPDPVLARRTLVRLGSGEPLEERLAVLAREVGHDGIRGFAVTADDLEAFATAVGHRVQVRQRAAERRT